MPAAAHQCNKEMMLNENDLIRGPAVTDYSKTAVNKLGMN